MIDNNRAVLYKDNAHCRRQVKGEFVLGRAAGCHILRSIIHLCVISVRVDFTSFSSTIFGHNFTVFLGGQFYSLLGKMARITFRVRCSSGPGGAD